MRKLRECSTTRSALQIAFKPSVVALGHDRRAETRRHRAFGGTSMPGLVDLIKAPSP